MTYAPSCATDCIHISLYQTATSSHRRLIKVGETFHMHFFKIIIIIFLQKSLHCKLAPLQILRIRKNLHVKDYPFLHLMKIDHFHEA